MRLTLALAVGTLLAFVPAAGAAPLTVQSAFGTLTAPEDLAVGDFNHDGDPDIVVANSGHLFLTLAMGGSGTAFGTTLLQTQPAINPVEVEVADIDGDGDDDIATRGGGVLMIFLRGSGGTFQAPTTVAIPDTTSFHLVDVNADSDPDLIVGDANTATISVRLGGAGATFGAPASFATFGAAPDVLTAADLNGDGDPDLVVRQNDFVQIGLMFGGPGGTFTAPPSSLHVNGTPAGAATADFDRDGDVDIAVAHATNFVTVLLNDGTGVMNDFFFDILAGAGPTAIEASDIDGDGVLDLVNTASAAGGVAYLRGQGNGDFVPTALPLTDVNPSDVAVGDFDGDGATDVAAANSGANSVSILRNTAAPAIQASPAAVAFATQPMNTLSAARTITVQNTGDGALRPRRVRMTGAAADDFVVTADTCSGEVVAPGANCALKLRFAPSATGARAATLRVESDAGVNDIALSGAGGALPAGPTGPPGRSGSATVRDRLVAAFATDRVQTRAGARLRVRFVSTLAGVATLELRRGTRVVRRVSDAVAAGRNTLTIRAPGKRGRYTLALTVTGGGETVTDAARLTVKRRPA